VHSINIVREKKQECKNPSLPAMAGAKTKIYLLKFKKRRNSVISICI